MTSLVDRLNEGLLNQEKKQDMRLTKQTDYALRTLIYLALYPDRLCCVDEIAEAYGISTFHVGKIVHKLGQLGFLEVRRGRGGGVKLKAAPRSIVIAEVIKEFEPDFHVAECFDADRDLCRITPSCSLKSIFGEAVAAFESVLTKYTLADVLKGNRPSHYRELLK